MVTLLKWFAVLLGLLVLALLLLLILVDFGRFKPQIEQAVSDATGRDFGIDGELTIRVLPSLRVSADNVSLSNAEWGSVPQMAEIGHLSAKVGLLSLISGPPVIRELQLRDVNVLLETDDSGEGNWVMGQPAPAEPPVEDETEGGALQMPVDIRSAELDNINLRYISSTETGLGLQSLSITTNEAGQYVIDGEGQWTEWPYSLSGLAADRQAELDVTLGDLVLRSTFDFPTDTVDFTAVLSTLDKLGEIVEVEGLPSADLSLKGNVASKRGSIILSNLLAELGSARLALDGEVDPEGVVSLSVEADGPSLAELTPELPEVSFKLASDAVIDGETVTLDPLTLNFADSDLQANAELTGGDEPGIKLRATSSLFDLTPFESPDPEGDETAEAQEPADPAVAGAPTRAKGKYIFTEEPLPLDKLRSLHADVEVSIDTFKVTAVTMRDLVINLTADDGNIAIDNSFGGTAGGRFRNQLFITAGADSADLTVNSGGRGMKLGVMSGDLPEEERPSTNLAIDIKARGGTARALAASTNGKVVMTQGPGRVKNDVISRFSGDVIAQLFKALNPMAETEEFTNWECSVIALEFTEGVGDMTAFLMQSEELQVVAGGALDLNTEKLRFEFNTKPREGVGLSADMFVTPFVKLSGTLASPGVGLNAKGALLTGGAAVMTGGLSFLYQGLMDRAMAESDRCPEALEQVGMGDVADSG